MTQELEPVLAAYLDKLNTLDLAYDQREQLQYLHSKALVRKKSAPGALAEHCWFRVRNELLLDGWIPCTFVELEPPTLDLTMECLDKTAFTLHVELAEIQMVPSATVFSNRKILLESQLKKIVLAKAFIKTLLKDNDYAVGSALFLFIARIKTVDEQLDMFDLLIGACGG